MRPGMRLVQPVVGPAATTRYILSRHRNSGCRQSGGLAGTMPAPSAPTITLAQQQADPALLKVYEVPSDLIGAVGARLQIAYHGNPRVRVATEPKTGQLMVMAPESIQRDINQKMQALIYEVRTSGIMVDDRGMSVASTKQTIVCAKELASSRFRERFATFGRAPLDGQHRTQWRTGDLSPGQFDGYARCNADRPHIGSGDAAGWWRCSCRLDSNRSRARHGSERSLSSHPRYATRPSRSPARASSRAVGARRLSAR